MASENEGYRCRVNGEQTSVGVRSGSVMLGIIGNRGIADISCPL